MLLSSRQSRSRQGRLFLSLVAACYACGVGFSSTRASENVSAPNHAEPNLRPTLPLDSKTTASGRRQSASSLTFRRPVIAGLNKTAKQSGRGDVKVPAKTVSNRVPARQSVSPRAGLGWVARDAVNLNQPLRDPGKVRDVKVGANASTPTPNRQRTPAKASPSAATKTVSPMPSYVGDQPPTLTESDKRDAARADKKSSVETKPRDKARPILVLPKDRRPNIPPAEIGEEASRGAYRRSVAATEVRSGGTEKTELSATRQIEIRLTRRSNHRATVAGRRYGIRLDRHRERIV